MDLEKFIKSQVDEHLKLTKSINTSKPSRMGKESKIQELEEKVLKLQGELIITKNVYNKYINGLLDSKEIEIKRLLEDPILTFPDNTQIQFSSLSEEQLTYLQSLGKKRKTM